MHEMGFQINDMNIYGECVCVCACDTDERKSCEPKLAFTPANNAKAEKIEHQPLAH